MDRKRYPFSALAQAMGLSDNAAVEALGIRGKQAQDARHRGVTERVAERLAGKAGLPTLAVWPEMVDERVAEVMRACEECGTSFVPAFRQTNRQRYCSATCKGRADGRTERRRAERRRHFARKWADPAYRAKKQAYSRLYRAQVREAELRRRERTCAAPDCDERFTASRGDQRYCSATCRRRLKMRRYRSTRGASQVTTLTPPEGVNRSYDPQVPSAIVPVTTVSRLQEQAA